MGTTTIVTDETKFDENQIKLGRCLIELVNDLLKEHQLDEEKHADLLESLSFQVAVLLDGDVIFSEDKGPLTPELTFRQGENTLLVSGMGGGWMHEYIHGLLDELAEAGDDEEDDGEAENEEATVESSVDESSAPSVVADKDSMFELVLCFASGLMIGAGYYDYDEPQEAAQSMANNLYFVRTSELINDAPTDDAINMLCPALMHLERVLIKVDTERWAILEEEFMCDWTFDELGKRIDEFVKEKLAQQ